MQNVLESSKGSTRDLPNICLVHQSLVEEIGCILFLLLLFLCATSFISVDVFLRHCTRDIEPHFNKLISACGCLATSILCATSFTAVRAILPRVRSEVEFNGNLVFPG